MKISAQLEAVLLYRGEPVSKKELASLLNTNTEGLSEATAELQSVLEGRGISLIETDDSLAFATSSGASELITSLEKQEYSSELSKPAMETLALIVYEGPIPKAKIDYVRGVNATFILRSLMTRGLVERITDPENARQSLYRATTELLGHLGVSSAHELPEFGEVRKELEERLSAAKSTEKKEQLIADLESDPDFDENE